MSEAVGWIGLGAMGAPMAACVARAGLAVSAYDIDTERAESIPGLTAASSAAVAAAEADILVLMVATADQVEAVLDDGVLDALRPGAVVVVMATVGPAAVVGWADRLAAQDVALVDAPVSGGVARAGEGDLLVMVSGDDAAVTRCRGVLDAIAREAPVVGPGPGDGQKVKLVNQLLCGVHIAAAGEALAFAEALGLDPAACLEVIRHGAAASFMLEDRGPRMTTGDFEPARSALDIFVKDMGLVQSAAREVSFPAPLAATAEQTYLAGRRAGLGRLDDASVIRVQQGRAGPPPPA
jgi:3-hydroxyisobutyrate dehydrogenase/putative dehydrogenase